MKNLEKRNYGLTETFHLLLPGKMAGKIAHDFNNLLIPLKGFPKLIQSRLNKSQEACSEFCNTMISAANRLMQINDQLLILTSLKKNVKELFNPNYILQEVAQLLADYFRNDLDIEYDIPQTPFLVEGRPEQVYRVFLNLLLNAREAIGEKKGKISIRSERKVLFSKDLKVLRACEGPYLKIMIEDDGIGIENKNLNKIFDSFFSTKQEGNYHRFGLGLSIVRDMINEHRGFIDVKSSPGKGTTFSIYFPLKD